MDIIKNLASNFRNAIEHAAELEADIGYFFKRFPYGCCGDASDLLAQYLRENGIDSTYVCGTHYIGDNTYDSQSHAWLLINNKIIVDITGDQFKYNSEFLYYDTSVYVGYGNKFYELFEVDKVRDVKQYYDTCLLTNRLEKLYGVIKKYI